MSGPCRKCLSRVASRDAPEGTLTAPLWFFFLADLGFNSKSGKSLRSKAEDKGSEANADELLRGAEEHRDEVGGGDGGGTGGDEGHANTKATCEAIASTVIATVITARCTSEPPC